MSKNILFSSGIVGVVLSVFMLVEYQSQAQLPIPIGPGTGITPVAGYLCNVGVRTCPTCAPYTTCVPGVLMGTCSRAGGNDGCTNPILTGNCTQKWWETCLVLPQTCGVADVRECLFDINTGTCKNNNCVAGAATADCAGCN